MRMRNIQHYKEGILHVETPLGIVNIYVGLRDSKGRRIEAVSMVPNRYAGEHKVVISRNRFVELKRKS